MQLDVASGSRSNLVKQPNMIALFCASTGFISPSCTPKVVVNILFSLEFMNKLGRVVFLSLFFVLYSLDNSHRFT